MMNSDVKLNDIEESPTKPEVDIPPHGTKPFVDGGDMLNIFIGSLNVGNAPLADLSNWIPDKQNYDIIVLGFQESHYYIDKEEVEKIENILNSMNIQIEPFDDEIYDMRTNHKEIQQTAATENPNLIVLQSKISPKVPKETLPETSMSRIDEEKNELQGQGELDPKVAVVQQGGLVHQFSTFLEVSDESDEEFDTYDHDKKEDLNDSSTKQNENLEENSSGVNIVEISHKSNLKKRFDSILGITKKIKSQKPEALRANYTKQFSVLYQDPKDGAKHLRASILAHLGHQFKLLTNLKRLEMRLRVYIRKELFNEVSGIELSSENTGFASLIANKGGLVCKFEILGTTLCFVSSHLAAHEGEKKAQKRDSNIQEIFHGARIGLKQIDLANQFDHCFWMGDLNYRVQPPIKDKSHDEKWEIVHDCINANDWETLNEWDQLNKRIGSKKIFVGWKALQPNFAPTFKVRRLKSSVYSRQRIPSYCDRILHKSLPGLASFNNLESFVSCPDFSSSDHKPIYATFRITPTPKVRLASEIIKNKRFRNKLALWPKLVISSLHASNLVPLDLGIHPSSDPYIIFYTSPTYLLLSVMKKYLNSANSNHMQNVFTSSISYPQTRARMNTLNPVWSEEIVIPLAIEKTNISDLRYCHIILVVMDKDLTSQDDTIGTAVISLLDVFNFCTEQNKPYHFSHELEYDGVCGRGVVEGDINLIIPTERESNISFKQQQSCCRIN